MGIHEAYIVGFDISTKNEYANVTVCKKDFKGELIHVGDIRGREAMILYKQLIEEAQKNEEEHRQQCADYVSPLISDLRNAIDDSSGKFTTMNISQVGMDLARDALIASINKRFGRPDMGGKDETR